MPPSHVELEKRSINYALSTYLCRLYFCLRINLIHRCGNANSRFPPTHFGRFFVSDSTRFRVHLLGMIVLTDELIDGALYAGEYQNLVMIGKEGKKKEEGKKRGEGEV